MRDDPGLEHHGLLRLMGQPLVFAATRTRDPGPPPTLGQHTGEILRELGYADGAIADLGRRGVIGGQAR